MKIFEVAVVTAATLFVTAYDADSSWAAVPAGGPVRAGSETPLDRLIDTELVGGNVAFFEAISGPAKRLDDWGDGRSYRKYEVNGCDVDVISEGQTIRAITLNVTPECNPAGFGMQFSGKTLNDAEAEIGGGRWVGGCLSMCGNSVIPTHSYEISAHKLNGGLNYRIDAVAHDEESDALFGWAARMRDSHGDDYVVEMAYQCDDAQEAGARIATKDMQIVSVTVSDDFEMLTCQG